MSENIENIEISPTFYLFALPSYWEGFGRMLDFGGVLSEYNGSPSPRVADNIAILNDWLAVGLDLRGSIEQFEETQK